MAAPAQALLRAEGLSLAVAGRLIQRELNFDVRRGEILVLMGGSGCGKSTLMRHLIGLQTPAAGRVLYGDIDLAEAGEEQLAGLRRQFGVMFQAGALWSSMTVGENVMLPLREFTELDDDAAEQLARFKLALVGLDGAFDESPAALSGGMKKRAAIARAMALDPPLLFLDEPSAGLDPLTSARLDELILNLRDHLGTSIVLVTHELDSIFAVADRALFLDAKDKTMIALDAPRQLLETGPDTVRAFLRRKERP
ncbi:ATP-binding cassette domain-containing protein [Paucibacter sediminis]|uniref:ATP-binding cassette domain-containing protein n=1 Tax=Paucibacter sediminis TaxID=3019553 RepID=A0AA95SPK1_9BURK|nr:ATP-binding cassette domain-containing protein [Paucibacter sp. S2-9]WIT10926.1 ATP-binding cassette domain-containing protein [Paucibacter sp. S2-9]